MAFTYWGKQSGWDVSNPANWVINKPLEQNIREFTTGTQLFMTSVPSAIAWKAGTAYAAPTVGSLTSGAGGAGAVAAGSAGTAATASLLPSALKMAEKGLDIGILAGITAWLQKYWWIPTIFIGLWTVGKFAK